MNLGRGDTEMRYKIYVHTHESFFDLKVAPSEPREPKENQQFRKFHKFHSLLFAYAPIVASCLSGKNSIIFLCSPTHTNESFMKVHVRLEDMSVSGREENGKATKSTSIRIRLGKIFLLHTPTEFS